MNLKAAKKEALYYIEPELRFCFTDCSDSMHEAESLRDRFNALVGDSIDIKDFIEKHLLKEYAATWTAIKNEYDLTLTEATNPGVSDLPIPYEKFKHLL